MSNSSVAPEIDATDRQVGIVSGGLKKMMKKLAALGLTAALAFAPMVALAQDQTPAATPSSDASPAATPMKHKAKSHKMKSHKMSTHKKSHHMKKPAPEASPAPSPSAT
jgi:hypothetical protein